jgi:hypothetical protein
MLQVGPLEPRAPGSALVFRGATGPVHLHRGCEFLGGVGLILPAMTEVKPKLTPFAAFGLTLVMILAAVFHIVRGGYNFVPTNLVLGGVAAFIAYGRLFVRPIVPASISTFHVLKGLVALGALVLIDFAPAWYRLIHIH